jgi:hypothetical protein
MIGAEGSTVTATAGNAGWGFGYGSTSFGTAAPQCLLGFLAAAWSLLLLLLAAL